MQKVSVICQKGLDESYVRRDTYGVRCGSLTGDGHRVRLTSNPEFLAGLCGSAEGPSSVELPSQGPAPLSTWGFFLGECFCWPCQDMGCMAGESIPVREAEQPGTPSDSGAALENAQQVIKSICTDRQGASANGPAWAAPRNHRHRETRPVQAVQPVSEGLKMPSRQVVRQTGCADGIAAPRVRWGVLMVMWNDSLVGQTISSKVEQAGKARLASQISHGPTSPSKHLGGARKPEGWLSPLG